MKNKTALFVLGCGAVLALAAMAGCTSTSDDLPSPLPGAVFQIDVGAFQPVADNDNNGFSGAVPVTLTSGQAVVIEGEIADTEDVDVYDLGSLPAGTQITVDVTAQSTLDTQITLFDESQALIDFNDDRNIDAGEQDPKIDHVLRFNVQQAYLAIEQDFVAKLNGNASVGRYSIAITTTPGQEIPPVRLQNLVVNFDGASSVTIEDYYSGSLPPFDPYLIDPSYEQQRDAMITLIMDAVRKDYEGFGVQVYRSSDPDVPWPDVTVVHVGGANPDLYGIANTVDDYNADLQEEAIVYAETFAYLIRSGDVPTTQEMSQAIANVITHESGHLLGLHHTMLNPGEIMQTTSTSPELLLDEAFGVARLDYHALGNQDAIKRLFYTVGGDPSVLTAPPLDTLRNKQAAAMARAKGLPVFDKSMFGTCRCRQCVPTKK
jgi:hypothetical protein